ncbi:hypothetical protein INS49_013798 [Diaporthe citri]|uniref:uncharacterized protein n=1 Tax=Diaporthe citri TaxID=83186 RepID=UPI001C81C30C|nr:uncharacterized protein INS49_013798 [Diaporthe citri]KAG6357915.1 hypothetical protein INS49_013798 [Diaporthe citri]
MDENPHWNIQHAIEHFIGPRTSPPPVEPAAVVEYPPVPVSFGSSGPRKKPVPAHLPPVLRFQPPVLEWNLAAEVQQEDQAREHSLGLSVLAPKPPALAHELPVLAPEPPAWYEIAVEAPLTPGHLPGTYVLLPVPLWQARHDLAPDVWPTKVTALVKAYGPFPERTVIIVSIRHSRGTDMTKEQYDRNVARCVEAASTLIRHIRSLGGQENRQFLIYHWIRTVIGSADDWFMMSFYLNMFRNGIPRTMLSSCRLKELEFVLDNLQPNTAVWWLSIGIDALTTDIENLRKVQIR